MLPKNDKKPKCRTIKRTCDTNQNKNNDCNVNLCLGTNNKIKTRNISKSTIHILEGHNLDNKERWKMFIKEKECVHNAGC